MSIYEFTKGKKVDVDYETGYHFVITYLSENKLHWDALSKTAEGAPAHEDEPYTSYDLGDGKYMVNWIEASGLVVSQIADSANGRVYCSLQSSAVAVPFLSGRFPMQNGRSFLTK